MLANTSGLTNAYAGSVFAPLVCEAPAFGHEADCPLVSNPEGIKLAKDSLKAIDLEVAAALCLSGAWHADRKGDVYFIRTIERIAEHMKVLKAAQTAPKQSSDGISISDLRAAILGN